MSGNQYTGQGRTVRLHVRLTTAEDTALRARASARGIDVSELVREALGLPSNVVPSASHEALGNIQAEACAMGKCAHFRHRTNGGATIKRK